MNEISDCRFQKMSEQSQYWLNCAKDLNAAVRVLYLCSDQFLQFEKKKIGLSESFSLDIALNRPILLNAGYAIELMLKACLVLQKSNIKGHNLINLSERAGVVFDENQKCTLRILSDAVTWWGRYPTPLSKEEFVRNSQNWDSLRQNKSLGSFTVQSTDEKKWPTYHNYCALWGHALSRYRELAQIAEL